MSQVRAHVATCWADCGQGRGHKCEWVKHQECVGLNVVGLDGDTTGTTTLCGGGALQDEYVACVERSPIMASCTVGCVVARHIESTSVAIDVR